MMTTILPILKMLISRCHLTFWTSNMPSLLATLLALISGLKILQQIIITFLWLRAASMKLNEWVFMILLQKRWSKRLKWAMTPPLRDMIHSWSSVRTLLFSIWSFEKRQPALKDSTLPPYTTYQVQHLSGQTTVKPFREILYLGCIGQEWFICVRTPSSNSK